MSQRASALRHIISTRVGWINSRYFVQAVRWLLVLVMLYAGIGKLLNFETTVIAVMRFGILPAGSEKIASASVITLEIVCGVLLSVRMTLRFGGALACCLLAVFTAVLAVALSNGHVFECGCFPGMNRQVSASSLLFSLALSGLSVVLIVPGEQSL